MSKTRSSRIIRAVAPLIADRATQLTDTICATSGKPRVDALGTELLTAVLLCRYYPRLAGSPGKRLRGFLRLIRVFLGSFRTPQ